MAVDFQTVFAHHLGNLNAASSTPLSAEQNSYLEKLLGHAVIDQKGCVSVPGVTVGTMAPKDACNLAVNKVKKMSAETLAKGPDHFLNRTGISGKVKDQARAAVGGMKGMMGTVQNNFVGSTTITGSKALNATLRGAGVAAGVGIAATIKKEDSWVMKTGKVAASVGVTAASLFIKGKGGKGI